MLLEYLFHLAGIHSHFNVFDSDSKENTQKNKKSTKTINSQSSLSLSLFLCIRCVVTAPPPSPHSISLAFARLEILCFHLKTLNNFFSTISTRLTLESEKDSSAGKHTHSRAITAKEVKWIQTRRRWRRTIIFLHFRGKKTSCLFNSF